MKLTEFSKVAQMLAKEHKIKIEEGRSWAANIKERKVFYKKNDIYNLSEEHILGLLLHEIAHIHYTTLVDMPKKNQEITGATLNMVEDISIEHIISKDYPNAGEILSSTKTEVLDTLVTILPKMAASLHEKSLLYGSTRFEGRGYTFQMEEYERIGDEIAKLMTKRATEIYDRKQTKDLMPLVEDIVKILLKEAGELTDQEKQEIAGGNNMHGQAQSNSDQTEAQGKIVDGLKASHGWKPGPELSTNVAYIDAIVDQAAIIGKQLRSVLKRNNAMEFGGRYRTGKLIAKRFVRIKVSKDRKPFARRIVKSNQSYAFAIASDISGSMFGGYSNEQAAGSYALSSMLMVGEALRLAGVPRSMIVFGNNAQIAAPMNKNQISWGQIANQQTIKKAGQGGTCIDRAITKCAEQLSKVRAERKIMIILTDGSSDLTDMQEAHKKATQEGIECLGITIGDERHSYMDRTFSTEKNTTIRDTSQTNLIGKAFIDILKASIKASPQ